MSKKTNNKLERDEQIYQLSTLVAGRFSLQEALDRLAEAAVKITSTKACSIRLLDEDAGDLVMRSTYGLSEEYRNKGVVSKNDTVIKAAFAGEAVVLDDMRVDDRVKYKEASIKEGLVSQLTVAMEFREKAVGVLRLYSPEPKRFNEEDIHIARAVASQCAVAITNARLYSEAIEGARIAEQMRLAGVVQRRMIPAKAPTTPGLDIAARYIPCFDLGGDFYDFFKPDENRLVIVIGDVMGKGIPAALMMSCFRGAVRAYVDAARSFHVATEAYAALKGRKALVKKAIEKVNQMACKECRGGEFITLFHASIDMKKRIMTYCSCGHEPAVLIREGQITSLEKGGLVLGVDSNEEYEIGTVQLKEGDSVLLYTDGLIDAANFDGELWGRDRLLEAAKKHADTSATTMLRNILRYRRRFVGLAKQIDDTSIVVIKADSAAGLDSED